MQRSNEKRKTQKQAGIPGLPYISANDELLDVLIGELLFCNFVSLGPFLALNNLEADLVALCYCDIRH